MINGSLLDLDTSMSHSRSFIGITGTKGSRCVYPPRVFLRIGYNSARWLQRCYNKRQGKRTFRNMFPKSHCEVIASGIHPPSRKACLCQQFMVEVSLKLSPMGLCEVFFFEKKSVGDFLPATRCARYNGEMIGRVCELARLS